MGQPDVGAPPQTGDLEVELAACRARLLALHGVREALSRLAELGPPQEIVDRAPLEAARALELDRVLLSRVDQGALVPEALHAAGEADDAGPTLVRLREAPVALDYPLVEGEVLRRRRPQLVRVEADDALAASRFAFAATLAWQAYVAAPIVVESRVIGFLHGDRSAGRQVGDVECDALGAFADGFALVFERAILRRRLRIQRQEMRQIASWADARTGELSDRAVTLALEREPADEKQIRGATPAGDAGALQDLLTRRELDVLELMVRGETNAGIARSLVVSEGTVKFHVKNILRKLHAANRAEATSRYLRLTLRRGDGPPRLPS